MRQRQPWLWLRLRLWWKTRQRLTWLLRLQRLWKTSRWLSAVHVMTTLLNRR